MTKTKRTCSVENCNRDVVAKGWCLGHYRRWRRHGDPLAGNRPNNTSIRWIESHQNYVGEDCLIWPFSYSVGYGVTRWRGKPAWAHRVMCTLVHGEPPTPTHHVAHSCGKGRNGCVNPGHLRWATPAENLADKILHGTHLRGERNGYAKLTTADVLMIRTLVYTKTQRKIAKQYNITPSNVNHIVRRVSWKWLP